MANTVAYFEITSADAPRAQRFYADLFDWTITADPDMEGYAMVDTGGGDGAVVGGIGPSQVPGDEGVKVYVRVDDLSAHLEAATRLGGTTVLEPMELPGGYGTIAVVLDPDGNPLGLWV